MEKQYTWFDTSAYGFQLTTFKSNGETLLRVISSTPRITGLQNREILERLGFKEAQSGNWYSKAWTDPKTKMLAPNIGQFRRALIHFFPKAALVSLTLPEIEGGVVQAMREEQLADISAQYVPQPILQKSFAPQEPAETVIEAPEKMVAPETKAVIESVVETKKEPPQVAAEETVAVMPNDSLSAPEEPVQPIEQVESSQDSELDIDNEDGVIAMSKEEEEGLTSRANRFNGKYVIHEDEIVRVKGTGGDISRCLAYRDGKEVSVYIKNDVLDGYERYNTQEEAEYAFSSQGYQASNAPSEPTKEAVQADLIKSDYVALDEFIETMMMRSDASIQALNIHLNATTQRIDELLAKQEFMEDDGVELDANVAEIEDAIKYEERLRARVLYKEFMAADDGHVHQYAEFIGLAVKTPQLMDAIIEKQPGLIVEYLNQPTVSKKLLIPGLVDGSDFSLKVVEILSRTESHTLAGLTDYDIVSGGSLPFKMEFFDIRANGQRHRPLKRLSLVEFKGEQWVTTTEFEFNPAGKPLDFDEQRAKAWMGFVAKQNEEAGYELSFGPNALDSKYLASQSPSQETPLSLHAQNVDATQKVLIGMNQHGLNVYEDNVGRVIEASVDYFIRMNEPDGDDYTASDFLLVRTNEPEHYSNDLLGIAKGLVRYSAEKPLNKTDIIHYLSKSHGFSSEVSETSSEYRALHEKIEFALLTELRSSTQTGKELYSNMITLLENQANSQARTSNSVKNGQYSTPLPLAIALNDLLNATEFPGGSLLEPTIGNGSLVSMVTEARNPGVEIVGYDLDENRINNANALLSDLEDPATIIQDDFIQIPSAPNSFDRVIMNPPFGKTEKFTFKDGLTVHRLDYKIAASALNSLKNDGIGLMIVGADGFLPTESGKISGGSRYFYNWLADNFAGVEVVELEGNMYRKMGAQFPIRVAVVAGRGKSEKVPDEIRVIKSHEELWEWKETAKNNLKLENTRIKMQDNTTELGIEHAGQVNEEPDNKAPVVTDSLDFGAPEVELQTPKFEKNHKGETFIGHNQDGECLYSDVVGIRFILDNGVRLTESVKLAVTGAGLVAVEPTYKERIATTTLNGTPSYLTQSEVENGAALKSKKSVGQRPALKVEDVAPEPVVEEKKSEFLISAEERIETMRQQSEAREALAAEQNEMQHEPLEVIIDDDFYDTHRVKEVEPGIIEARKALEVISVNEAQARYVPMSNTAESEFLVPINMAHYIKEAQAKFMQEFGDADHFVAENLDYEVSDLSKYFSSEQVDSLAFAIASAKKGKGFIVGDMTGLGKGRVMAGLIKYSVRTTGKAFFVTEKAGLFQDIYRDLTDIGYNPKLFLLNSEGSTIYDNDTSKPLHTHQSTLTKKFVATGEWPAGAEVVLSTYSQLNRQAYNNKKVEAVIQTIQSNRPGLILDESHNAAGNGSNTNVNIKHLVALSEFATYSSATSNKSALTMALYESCFPSRSVDLNSLEETLLTGGAPLLEAVTSALAADQSLLTRQHDMSQLAFNEIPNNESFEVNKVVTDAIAELNVMLATFSGELQTQTKEVTKKLKEDAEDAAKHNPMVNAGRAGITSTNFGSRLYQLSKTAMFLENVDLVIATAKESIKNGEKVVIAMEGTMGALLSDFVAENAVLTNEGMVVERSPNLSDVYHTILNRMRTVQVRTGWGASEQKDMLDIILSQIKEPELHEAAIETFNQRMEAMHNRIDEVMPFMDANPIDNMIQQLSAAGITSGEVSGRTRNLLKLENGNFLIQERNSQKGRNNVISGFNNGKLDAIFITTAGMTGISLHASEKFKDQRKRNLIVAQPPSDPNVFMQMLGRVNRKGQTNLPRITVLNNLMPSSYRLIAMLNHKLMNQSASTQANRDSKFKTDSTPDLLNKVGDDVVFDYLTQNPEKLNQLHLLGVKLDIDDNSNKLDMARRVTGYIGCFTYEEQVEIYNELTNEFNLIIEELEKKGINPLSSKVYDFKAVEVSSKLHYGVEKTEYDSAFEKPVYLKEIRYEIPIVPLSSSNVKSAIAHGENIIATHHLSEHRPDLMSIREHLIDRKERLLKSSVGKAFESVEEALLDDKEGRNRTQIMNENLATMLKALEKIKPGSIIEYTDHLENVQREAVITIVKVPDIASLHLPSQYSLRMATPGRHVEDWSLSALLKDESFSLERVGHVNDYPDYFETFDSVEPGVREITRVILDGNPLKCAELAMKKGAGEIAFYTNEQGQRQLAAIMPLQFKMLDMELGVVHFDQPEIIVSYLKDKELNPASYISNTEKEDKNKTVMFSQNSNREWLLKVPGTKKHGGHIFLDEKVCALIDDGEFAGTRDKMIATVPEENLEDVVNLVVNKGVVFGTNNPNARAWMLEEMRALLNKQKAKFEEKQKLSNPMMPKNNTLQ